MNNNTNKRMCKIEGCNNVHLARGYCNKHYLKLKRYGDPLYEKKKKVCIIDGCSEFVRGRGLCQSHYFKMHNKRHYEKHKSGINGKCEFGNCTKPAYVRGYCVGHYQRFLKYGDPSMSVRAVDIPDECKMEGCNDGYYAKGLCEKHYRQKQKREYLQSDWGRENNRLNCQKRRAIKRNSPFHDLSLKDWKECLEAFSNECAYCGDAEVKLTQEHIIPIILGGSHTKTNVIPSCQHCNSSKGDRLLEEWYTKQPYYSREREEKILKWMGYKPKENKIQLQLF